jgi:LAS superfamily LD-carboxypeptidase LdcB
MANVPYNPIPQDALTGQPTPRTQVNTPGAAFGTNIAEAVQHLGNVGEHVGNELFSRAVAMQELNNSAEKDTLEAQGISRLGDLHAQYGASQGRQAVDGYQPLMKDSNEVRTDIVGQASNPTVAKQVNSTLMQQVARLGFNAAGHAATENKEYAKGASSAKVASLQDSARYVKDDKEFNEVTLPGIAKQVRDTQLDVGGASPDQAEQKVFEATSKAIANRIDGISTTEPVRAKALLDDAVSKHQLHSNDLDKVTNKVESELASTGARSAARTIIDEAKSPAKFLEDRGKGLDGGGLHPVFADRLQSAVMDAEKATGSRAEITDLFRDPKRQAQYFANYVQHPITYEGVTYLPGAKGGLAAPPGQSRHQLGQAADIRPGPVLDYLHNNAEKYGLEFLTGRNFSLDPVHIQLSSNPPQIALKQREPTEANLADRAEAQANKDAPGNARVKDAYVSRTIADFNQQKQFKSNQDYFNGNTIQAAIVGGHGGTLPTNPDELRATDPKVADAWDHMDPIKQKPFLAEMRQNAKGDQAWTSEGLNRFQRLDGMSRSSNDDAREEFLNTRMASEQHIPNSEKKTLIERQNKMKAESWSDPRTAKIMKNLQPILGPAGLGTRTTANAEQHDQFLGALQDALTDFQDNHAGRQPTLEEQQQMGTRLLQEQNTHWWQSSQKQFESPVPDELLEKVKTQWPGRHPGEPVPTDEQIRREFTRQQYQKLYGGTVAKDEASK